MRASILRVQREASLSCFAHEQGIARLQFIEMWRQCAFGHQLEKKFDFLFPRRGRDRVGPFNALAINLNTKGCVLPGGEFEVAIATDANHPQVGGEIRALYDLSLIKPF